MANFIQAQLTADRESKLRLYKKAIDDFEKSGLISLYTPGNVTLHRQSFSILLSEFHKTECFNI
jgi:hypothetical protein